MKIGIVISGFVRNYRATYVNYCEILEAFRANGFEVSTYFSIWDTIGRHTEPKANFIGSNPSSKTWVDNEPVTKKTLDSLFILYEPRKIYTTSFTEWREENQEKIEEIAKKWGKEKRFHYILNSCFSQSYLLSDTVSRVHKSCDLIFRYRTDIKFNMELFRNNFPKKLAGFCTPFYSNNHIVDNCWFLSSNYRAVMSDFYEYLFTLTKEDLNPRYDVVIESILQGYLQSMRVNIVESNFWCKGRHEILRMVER